MSPENAMKNRVNAVFWVLCLTVGVQFLLQIPIGFFLFLRTLGLPVSEYLTDVIVPQFFYPLFLGVIAVITLLYLRIPRREVFSVSRPRGGMLPWFGFFLGCVTVGNYLMNAFLLLLEMKGFPLPDPVAADAPRTVLQAVGFFLVYAVMPALGEELVFRVMVAGGLKEFHPWVAVAVSAFGFGMAHGALQQIPYAIMMGLLFGFVYVKSGNVLYPILFHFVNNAWASAITFLRTFAGSEIAGTVGFYGDLLFIFCGIVSAVYLLKNKQFTLRELPRSLDGRTAFGAVLKAPAFWGFTGIFLLLTVLNFTAQV